MTGLNKIKKIKKIRLHREGTHILITSAILLLIINTALYWGIECKIPFYIIAIASIILYLLMVNFSVVRSVSSVVIQKRLLSLRPTDVLSSSRKWMSMSISTTAD